MSLEKRKKGGPGLGQGRKPKQAEAATVRWAVRLTPAESCKLKELGGADWFRSQLSLSSVGSPAPASPESTHEPAPASPESTHEPASLADQTPEEFLAEVAREEAEAKARREAREAAHEKERAEAAARLGPDDPERPF